MRKTIEEEMREPFLKEELIQGNALLIYRPNEKDKKQVDVCLRYVENNSIKEQRITMISQSDMEDSGIVVINPDGTAIATYKKVGEDYELDRIYSIKEHSFSNPDFMELDFHFYFPESTVHQFIKKRGTEGWPVSK